MKKILIAISIILVASNYCLAVEKKPLVKVDSHALTSDAQVTLPGAGDNHIALAWWIPNEFWKSILSRNRAAGALGEMMLDAMSGISLLAVVQTDITPFGLFNYYSKQEIEKNLRISFSNGEGKNLRLPPQKIVNSNLEGLLGFFKPILGAAMGNLGNNIHFYILNDKTDSSTRLLDPYLQGQIEITLLKRDKTDLTGIITLPLNSLFVSRKCPNGKEAHVSWEFCPWSGKRPER